MALSKRQIPYLFSTVVLLIGGILFFTFPIRNIFGIFNSGPHLAIPVFATIYMGVLYLLVLSTFFLASFVDPGIYPREPTDEEDDSRHPLYRVITIDGVQVKMKWCDSCKFYRPPRCSHCSICDNCVESFDHHCPWVDNCIGKRNYKYFFYFVSFLTVFILSGFGWCVLSIVLYAGNNQWTSVIIEFILLAVGMLVFIPVVGLTGFHCGLVCMGRTTNEHITGKFRGSHNPFNEGCARNCAKTLCGSKQPRYMHYHANSYVSSVVGQRSDGAPLYEELDVHHHSLQREEKGASMDRHGRETHVPIQMTDFGNLDNSTTASSRSLEIAEVTV
ncbi:hypothetical protein EMCRGX_G024732 [Ephydatia muelleri]